MHNKYILLTLGMVSFTLSPSFSWADDIKGPDPNPTPTVQGPISDKINNPNPHVSNPSPEIKFGTASPDPNSPAPAAIKIQEGTNAEG
jgi:hypothetical protein